MKKSDINPLPNYYDRYIDLVDDLPIKAALDKHFTNIQNLNVEILESLGDQVYAPEKWTIREIMQHLVDWERIFSYRALIFARNDQTPVPGHDQDAMSAQSKANFRTLDSILDDYQFARQATISLYKNFDSEDLQRKGNLSKGEISVLALGYVMIGHQIHHFNVIQERYLPLIGAKSIY